MELSEVFNNLNKKQDIELNKFELALKKALNRLNDLIIANALNDVKDPLTYDFKFNQYLQESGYYNVINNFVDNGLDIVYSDVIAALSVGGLAVSFSKEDITKIEAIKRLNLQKFSDLSVPTINKMKDSIYKYSLSNLSVNDITNGLRSSLVDSDLFKYSGTYANTIISDYTQSIIDLKSSESDGVWIYDGVQDKVTRPFCNCVLNQKKYYDDSEKSKIQGDKRRAYNCRHIFLLVTEEYAIDQGYKSGSASC